MSEGADEPSTTTDAPKFRYDAALANSIERHWQETWAAQGTYHTPNPSGPLRDDFERVEGRPKLYVLDMFPYPSGEGLHVGHPLGYIGTDVYARFKRMTGYNVMHVMGFDSFGLPAEQHAVQTGTHPRVTTERNVENYKRQMRAIGFGYDWRRSVNTSDPTFYKWTQWIFLQLFNSWFDADEQRARPISALVEEFESGTRVVIDDDHPDGVEWTALSDRRRREVIDDHRLAYIDEAPVNWCPGLGTVLANEEVTSEGRSERGNFPVFRRPLKQWKLRITAYAERLIADLDLVDWPEPVKLMQRNWIGRSEGARIDFPIANQPGEAISVFTTRPDTVFGATFMVLAPEHPLVDHIVAGSWGDNDPPSWRGSGLAGLVDGVPATGWDSPSEAVAGYRRHASMKSDLERQVESRQKTGVFTGAYCINPVNGEHIPIFIADYVLMGYGTGAIMAVPGQDERDWEFAEAFDLRIVRTVQPPSGFDGRAFTGEGPAINSDFLNGLGITDAKQAIIRWLEEKGRGEGTVTYKLRDWLFSRQRYWGEPFPIVFDEDDMPLAVPESMLPVELPDLEDWTPTTSVEDEDSIPEPPLGRATQWREVEIDLGGGPKVYRRELNTMPQWAGSCWYYLRYLDPTNENAFVGAEVERYWMRGARPDGSPKAGGVDLYVGGVEHAVLHLLYSRFWHKVLFDLNHVSTPEPFQRLFNQGMIQAAAYADERGVYVEAGEVAGDEQAGFFHAGRPVTREFGKMGKSLKNSVSPEEIYDAYGADTLRLYEMAMGPLDQDRPWNTRDIIGVHRFLQRLWRNLVDEEVGGLRVSTSPPPADLKRTLHRTIAGVRDDMDGLRFNTAVAKLIELNNALTKHVAEHGSTPREVADALVLMLAPLAPHVAEELWHHLGNESSVVWSAFPSADASLLVDDTVELPVQINGKVRSRITVAAAASRDAIEAAALADPAVQSALAGRPVQKAVIVPGRMVSLVV
ncbi:MAG TPA: class I tRNA ligase family protein [Acidimicrobiales bacterium]|nr:class I tRNA ligase family protein [Acidimicrobiales bacterium]